MAARARSIQAMTDRIALIEHLPLHPHAHNIFRKCTNPKPSPTRPRKAGPQECVHRIFVGEYCGITPDGDGQEQIPHQLRHANSVPPVRQVPLETPLVIIETGPRLLGPVRNNYVQHLVDRQEANGRLGFLVTQHVPRGDLSVVTYK